LYQVHVPDTMGNTLFFTGTFTGAAGWKAWSGDGIRTWLFRTKGNVDAIIRWGPYYNPSIKFSDTLYVPAHDTTTYTIHY